MRVKTVRIKISGLVQGPNFKKFIADESMKIGIKGHVRNLDSGEVEVMAEGAPEEVDAVISLCKKGAPHSTVKGTDIQELNHIGFDDFKILEI
jgi:acylphosphatase